MLRNTLFLYSNQDRGQDLYQTHRTGQKPQTRYAIKASIILPAYHRIYRTLFGCSECGLYIKTVYSFILLATKNAIKKTMYYGLKSNIQKRCRREDFCFFVLCSH